jgi:hypothetical protein
VVDEAAYLERPQLIEAALTATTDCRINISSPLVGTLFHEFCASSPLKFTFDVSDAPWHTPEWTAAKKAELEGKGLAHIYKREYLRDATAGIAGQLIDAERIEAAVGAYQRMQLDVVNPGGKLIAALDVADGGADANALAVRHGCRVLLLEKRRDLRADQAGAWAYAVGREHNVDELRYDAIGVGAGASAALRGKDGSLTAGGRASGCGARRRSGDGQRTRRSDWEPAMVELTTTAGVAERHLIASFVRRGIRQIVSCRRRFNSPFAAII